MNPEFDNTDASILSKNLSAWNALEGARVGDFVHMPDGSLRRFTHHWGDSIQTTCGPMSQCAGDVSFYLGEGYTSFSGSLDSSIPLELIKATDETREGSFWFFHHGDVRAHNGVYFKAECRTFRIG